VVCEKRFFRATSRTEQNRCSKNNVSHITGEDRKTYNERSSGNMFSVELGVIKGVQGGIWQVGQKTNWRVQRNRTME
jgi:hypothetical protein